MPYGHAFGAGQPARQALRPIDSRVQPEMPGNRVLFVVCRDRHARTPRRSVDANRVDLAGARRAPTPFVRRRSALPNLDAGVVSAADIGASPPDDTQDRPARRRARLGCRPMRADVSVWRQLIGTTDFWRDYGDSKGRDRPGRAAPHARAGKSSFSPAAEAEGKDVQRQSQRCSEKGRVPSSI